MTDYEFAGSMTEIMNLQEVNWKMSSTTVFFKLGNCYTYNRTGYCEAPKPDL